MNVRTSEERQNLHWQTLNDEDDDDDDDDTSAKPLHCVLLALRLRLVGEMSEQAAASRDLESGRKNRESAEDDDIGERRNETRHKTPVGRRPPRRALAEDYTPPYNLYRISISYNTRKYNTENAYFLFFFFAGYIYIYTHTHIHI
jgi:hypothetical protein